MRPIASLLFALTLSLSAFACRSGGHEGFVKPAQAHALVEGGAQLVDVRTPEEYKADHIPGAINIPLDDLESRLSELPDKDADIVVYCKGGGQASQAQQLMQSKGYSKVHNLGARSSW